MEGNITMDKDQIVQLISNYIRWIEIGVDQIKHIQIGIDMATSNISKLVDKIKEI